MSKIKKRICKKRPWSWPIKTIPGYFECQSFCYTICWESAVTTDIVWCFMLPSTLLILILFYAKWWDTSFYQWNKNNITHWYHSHCEWYIDMPELFYLFIYFSQKLINLSWQMYNSVFHKFNKLGFIVIVWHCAANK